ncbi:MAG: hypothetical protein AB1724_03795 [Thermodesulfobacteriota bacterium]
MILARFIPGGSDGFKYFYLQYYFLNNVVNYGEIPQWCPFLTHGAIMTWWYIYQGGILQDALLLSGSLLKAINFIPVFYCGIFVDHLLLLAGVWLLGKRFYASPFTLLFVALSIMGSSVWVLQVWWNFHFYYALPLILYLGHRFIDSGQWRYFLLAGNLLVVQAVGGLPYFLPVTTLVLFLYFLFYCLLHLRESREAIRRIRFGRPFVVTIAVTTFSLVALYAAMDSGTDQVQVANLMRNADGSVGLDVFLIYGGKLNWKTWLELVLGISPAVDYNLYAGIFCAPFVLIGIVANTGKRNIHWLLTTVALALFSMGTFVSIIFYYGWPMMKYFRHLALVIPIVRIFLCFLAGFGIETLFRDLPARRRPLLTQSAFAVMTMLMIGIAGGLFHLHRHYESAAGFYESMVPGYLPLFLTIFDAGVMDCLIARTAIFALLATVILAGITFIRWPKFLSLLAILLLITHAADIYGYKYAQIRLRTAALNDELYAITAFQPMPYSPRRAPVYESDNSRAALLDVLPMEYGVLYWTTHAFLFLDQLGNPFKTDNWLAPLDQYLRAYRGQAINDVSVPLRGLVYPSAGVRPRLEFPKEHPAALKISGVTEDKIQFFSGAEVVASDDMIAAYITDPAYNGDILFLSPLAKPRKADSPVERSALLVNGLSADARLRPPYQVRRFDSNNLDVTIQNDDSREVWMLYSDVWHPFWRAAVNGKETPVYKANLAYKAIKLEKGSNEVHFYFNSRLLSTLYTVIGLNSLFWLMMIIYLTARIVIEGFGERKRLC